MMSAEIVIFTPRAEREARGNLEDFISLCRDKLTAYGATLDFDADEWDITDFVKLKGMGQKRMRLRFYTQPSLKLTQPLSMSEPFKSFAKSYLRYSQALRPTQSTTFSISALRMLHEALAEGEDFSPTRISIDVLNRAAQLADENYEGSAYAVGTNLKKIAEFLERYHLTSVPINGWKNPVSRNDDHDRVGAEFDKRRADKLPSTAALNALPKIFRLAEEKTFVLVASIAAMLCAAPDRINEVLMLPVDCEVHDKDGKGNEVYGLRWWPAKGADPMVKWVVPSMKDVVIEAIAKIKKCSNHARNVARWYENNPDKVYLLPEYEYLREKTLLSNLEVGFVLYGKEIHRSIVNAWYKGAGVTRETFEGKFHYRFADVERHVLAQLPRGFPWLNRDLELRFSNALMVACRNDFATDKATWVGVIDSITTNQINNRLGPRDGSSHVTIFEAFGFTEPDGSPIKVTTHQFRHYLNTLAQAGGMSQLDIAKWSGRSNIHQNAAYDHVSAEELVLKIRRDLASDCDVFGAMTEIPKRVVISRDEFARLRVPTAHTTEFGACIHDYTMAPCQMHADCMNCPEQVCIKGDEVRNLRIRAEFQRTQEDLAAAQSAEAAGDFGASRWVSHHAATLERLTQLCAILDDPAVPNGAVIRLASLPTVSRIEQAISTRALLEDGQPGRGLADAPNTMLDALAMMENLNA